MSSEHLKSADEVRAAQAAKQAEIVRAGSPGPVVVLGNA